MQGLVIHELCREPYHWASTRTLDKWLADEGVPGISGVDTRRLTKKLRMHGVMLGVLQVFDEHEEPNLERLKSYCDGIADPNLIDLVKEVSVKKPIKYNVDGKYTVVLIDCGVKYSIIRNLLKRGINVVRVPYDTSASEVMSYKPNGVFLSNGPGDPKKCTKTIECIRELVEKVPLMGICLGAQILALSMGGDTYKLKFGHRAQNQPARDLNNNRCYITTQNHGYAVDQGFIEEYAAWNLGSLIQTIKPLRASSIRASLFLLCNGILKHLQARMILSCCLICSQKLWRLTKNAQVRLDT